MGAIPHTAAPSPSFPKPAAKWRPAFGGEYLTRGVFTLWLSIMVLLPLIALLVRSTDEGMAQFWDSATNEQTIEALRYTILVALAVTGVNVVFGTLIAWVLVRDDFRGKGIVNSLIDLPFALPTIVAGLTLLALYGQGGLVPGDITLTTIGVILALLFVTLPFVVRAVQPTLLELDRDMEDAAASLGADRWTTFRRIVLPNLRPAILAGAALAFARAIGEFGSLVLIAKTGLPVASIFIFNQIESGNETGAAVVSVVLLGLSLLILLTMSWFSRRGVFSQ